MELLKSAGLCFRCLNGIPRAKERKKKIKCAKCKSTRHATAMHKEKENPAEKDQGKEYESKCTSICMLVDTKHKITRKTFIDYAVVDEQSNTSLITPNLEDLLEINTPKEEYWHSIRRDTKETKYGHRVDRVVVKSLHGTVYRLPKLVEYERKYRRPRWPNTFPSKVPELPTFDKNTGIELLISRDSPELLKVRAFQNGRKT